METKQSKANLVLNFNLSIITLILVGQPLFQLKLAINNESEIQFQYEHKLDVFNLSTSLLTFIRAEKYLWVAIAMEQKLSLASSFDLRLEHQPSTNWRLLPN